MRKVLAVVVLCVVCAAGTALAQPHRKDEPHLQQRIPHALSRDRRMPPDFRSDDRRPPHSTDGHKPPMPESSRKKIDDNRR